jgi:DNA-binding NtrC family response regulator
MIDWNLLKHGEYENRSVKFMLAHMLKKLGSKAAVAQKLGVARYTLHRKMVSLGLIREEEKNICQ